MNAEDIRTILRELAAEPLVAGPELLNRAQDFLLCMHEKVTWEAQELPGGQRFWHGRQGVCEFFIEYLSAWAWYTFRPVWIEQFGEDFLLKVEEVGMSKHGVPVKREHYQAWFVEGGKVFYWGAFRDRADALACFVPDEEIA